jgi:hypothetical protein
MSKDHHTDNIHTSRRKITNKIMSIESPDHEVEFYMVKEPTMTARHHHSLQMDDGDKKNQDTLENFLDEFQQQRFPNNQKHIIDMINKHIRRPVPRKPTLNNRLKQSSVSIKEKKGFSFSSKLFLENLKSSKNWISHFPSSQIDQSVSPLNRSSTWRKLQANITPSHYNNIQLFQQERQQHSLLSTPHPIMLSPLNKQLDEIENSETSKPMLNITNSYISSTSLSIDSPTSLAHSSSSQRIIQSINIDQQILDDDHDEDSNVATSVTNLLKIVHQSETYSTQNITTENEGNIIFEKDFIINRLFSF